MIIVQNLHTGVVDGHWDGISHASLEKMLGNKWKFESIRLNPKGGGHRGLALIIVEKSVAGYNRAKEMAAFFSEKGQGRADWERLRPKLEVNGRRFLCKSEGTLQRKLPAGPSTRRALWRRTARGGCSVSSPKQLTFKSEACSHRQKEA
ncbi:XS domain-containing protein [Klebsormidium nitens]|uniref:XS domain-containing protein n=1 Tax=Klebsormidium nitens TaxID=105231 RepID=A0A1Y1IBZ0_KLENI|nr:XS domain-containing protein [Klebsormidium nitens]|eukprot:GAQ86939.1 XS domain-containing protein [Klebsormidium nitens]